MLYNIVVISDVKVGRSACCSYLCRWWEGAVRTDPGFASAAVAGVFSSPPGLGSQTGSFYLYDYDD